MSVPLFLLHAVLVPGARLPLKVFEARYVDMVSRCLKAGEPFGICLLRSGSEVGAVGVPHSVGTLAHIEHCESPQTGILMLRVRGGERFQIQQSHKHGELLLTDVTLWPEEPALEVPERYAVLVEFLQDVLEGTELTETPDYNDAAWVSWRLVERLPVIHEIRQRWLEMRDPILRLADIQQTINQLAEGLEE